MKHLYSLITLSCVFACALLTSCRSGNGSVWDDNKVISNYKGIAKSLWSNEEASNEDFFNSTEEDFIPLKEEDLRPQFTENVIPQPKHSPGEKGSSLPGLEAFHAPVGAESAIFKNVYFNTDDHILRDKQHLATIDRIASYMKSHLTTYLFISGHCDERAPEAYNLALGARRSNSIRTLLVQKGIDPERIHTVSYGKERPMDLGHTQEAWAKNRRGEFRIYQNK